MKRHVIVGLLTAITFSTITHPHPAQAGLVLSTTAGMGAGTAIAGGIMMGAGDPLDEKNKKLSSILLFSGLAVSVVSSAFGTLGFLVLGFSQVDQLDAEIAAGQGPTLDALATALGVSRADLSRAFRASRTRQPVVKTEEDSARFTALFLHELAPAVRVRSERMGEFLTQLQQERERPGFPDDAPQHMRLAEWMGVPLPAVIVAVSETLDTFLAERGRGGQIQSARRAFYAEPLPLLRALADRISTGHEELLLQRLTTLCTAVSAIDPLWAQEITDRIVL